MKRNYLKLMTVCLLMAFTFSGITKDIVKERILCFGDSITQGTYINGRYTTGKSWVDLLEKRSAGSLKCINAGRSGRMASQKGELLPYFKKHQNVDQLLIYLGVNDLHFSEDKNKANLSNCVKSLQWVIDKSRQKYGEKLKISIISSPGLNIKTVTPHFQKIGYTRLCQEYLKKLSPLYHKLAKKNGCNFINLWGVVSPQNYSDGVHPNLAGQEQTAEFIWKKLINGEKTIRIASKIIYVEGAGSGSGNLSLIVTDKITGTKIVEKEFPIEISSVTDMFHQKSFRKVMGDDKTGESKHEVLSKHAPNLPYNMGFDGTTEIKKKLFWVHGFKYTADETVATFSEAFKRLYHQGFKGELVGIQWYGNPQESSLPKHIGPHYHQAVVNSFHAGKLLSEYINENIDDQKLKTEDIYLLAHSLGGMVVSNAIAGGTTYTGNLKDKYAKYFALCTAVPLEAYGQKKINQDMIKFEAGSNKAAWPEFCNDEMLKKMTSSGWHELFDDDESDNRSKLTWNDFFISGQESLVANGKMINFYSDTEEVLRNYPGSSSLLDGANGFRTYAWAKQEKFKGRRDDMPVGMEEALGISSDYCGWTYSWPTYHNRVGDHWLIKTVQEIKAMVTVNDVLNKDLVKTEPLFKVGEDSWGEDWFGGESMEPLLGLITDKHDVKVGGTMKQLNPSEFVGTKMSELDDFKDYDDFGNSPCNEFITMREWLLAHAFPATTLPTGGNPLSVQVFPPANNINLSGMKSNDGDGVWPKGDRYEKVNGVDGKSWWHEDYEDLPYQFTYKFFEKLVEEIK